MNMHMHIYMNMHMHIYMNMHMHMRVSTERPVVTQVFDDQGAHIGVSFSIKKRCDHSSGSHETFGHARQNQRSRPVKRPL